MTDDWLKALQDICSGALAAGRLVAEGVGWFFLGALLVSVLS